MASIYFALLRSAVCTGPCGLQLRLQQEQAEVASRQDAARLGAMNAKLTKDYNRVNAIAVDLGHQVRGIVFFCFCFWGVFFGLRVVICAV